MSPIIKPATLDDLIRLLKAWRFWVSSALLGALLGAALFYLSPPPYRARATVNVDFNIEDAWPDHIDRQQFYFLEREARKLEEIAWSDVVLEIVASNDGEVTLHELREEVLLLSRPGEAGWHFFADDNDRERAELMASTWALAFVEEVEKVIANEDGIDSFIRVEATQISGIPVQRKSSLSAYLLSGTLGFMFICTLGFLFFDFGRK